jgi:hypothetical protein
MLELATHSRAVSSRSNHWKPAWAFLVAAALVLLAIGLVPLLLLDSEGDTPVEPAVGETPALDTGWERIAPDLSGMLAVSPDLGMVIVHLNEPEVGVRAWHSPDGQIWTEATGIGGDENVFVTDVVAMDSGFISVGNNLYEGRSLAWVSEDGLHWEEIDENVLPRGDCASLWEVASNQDRIVTVGCSGTGGDGLWHSEDGRQWERVTLTRGGVFGYDIAAGEAGFLAKGEPDAVMVSPNGVDWTRVEMITPPDNDSGLLAVGNDGRLLLAGSLEGKAMVWTSLDHGETWTRGEMRFEDEFRTDLQMEMNYLTDTSFGYVGVGVIGDMDEELEEDPFGVQGFIIHSPNGIDWTAMNLEGAPPFTELTVGEDGIYGTFAGYGHWVWKSEMD